MHKSENFYVYSKKYPLLYVNLNESKIEPQ